jgi:hypothetical protein
MINPRRLPCRSLVSRVTGHREQLPVRRVSCTSRIQTRRHGSSMHRPQGGQPRAAGVVKSSSARVSRSRYPQSQSLSEFIVHPPFASSFGLQPAEMTQEPTNLCTQHQKAWQDATFVRWEPEASALQEERVTAYECCMSPRLRAPGLKTGGVNSRFQNACERLDAERPRHKAFAGRWRPPGASRPAIWLLPNEWW